MHKSTTSLHLSFINLYSFLNSSPDTHLALCDLTHPSRSPNSLQNDVLVDGEIVELVNAGGDAECLVSQHLTGHQYQLLSVPVCVFTLCCTGAKLRSFVLSLYSKLCDFYLNLLTLTQEKEKNTRKKKSTRKINTHIFSTSCRLMEEACSVMFMRSW